MKKVASLVFSIVLFTSLSLVVGAAGKSELADARKGTAKYHDVERALEDGYVATDHLVVSPRGVMGYHYVNPLLVDNEVNAATPEVLLYVPKKNGDLQLVGVEYLSVDSNSLFGQEFDKPSEAVPQYSLHVWIWKNNPQGMFAPFNPSIKIK